jgi:hypothetical protein
VPTQEQVLPLSRPTLHKALKHYDCVDEPRAGPDWVAFYATRPPPHARCPIFRDEEYEWVDVALLDYLPL